MNWWAGPNFFVTVLHNGPPFRLIGNKVTRGSKSLWAFVGLSFHAMYINSISCNHFVACVHFLKSIDLSDHAKGAKI